MMARLSGQLTRRRVAAAGGAALATAALPAFANPLRFLCGGSPLPSAPGAPLNTMSVANKSGTVQTNYPLQFGRPFMRGEIANYPKILIDGTPATTQADVKNRHPDGSVKFAVLSVVVPTLPSSGSVALTFTDQATGNNTPLSKADMLDAAYDFEATISLRFTPFIYAYCHSSFTTTATWKAITNGTIAILVDGVRTELTGLNFSRIADVYGVNAILKTAFLADSHHILSITALAVEAKFCLLEEPLGQAIRWP